MKGNHEDNHQDKNVKQSNASNTEKKLTENNKNMNKKTDNTEINTALKEQVMRAIYASNGLPPDPEKTKVSGTPRSMGEYKFSVSDESIKKTEQGTETPIKSSTRQISDNGNKDINNEKNETTEHVTVADKSAKEPDDFKQNSQTKNETSSTDSLLAEKVKKDLANSTKLTEKKASAKNDLSKGVNKRALLGDQFDSNPLLDKELKQSLSSTQAYQKHLLSDQIIEEQHALAKKQESKVTNTYQTENSDDISPVDLKSNSQSISDTTDVAHQDTSLKETKKDYLTDAVDDLKETHNGDQEDHLNKIKVKKRKNQNKIVSKIVAVIVVTLLVSIGVFAFSFYRYWQSSLKPLDSDSKKLVQVNIPIGSSTKEIGNILEEDSVIKSGFVFTYYVKMNNLSDFQGGYYQMSPNMSLDEISKLLKQGGTAEPEALADSKIVIPEGQSIAEIADIIAKKTKFTKKEFLDFVNDETFFKKMLAKYPKLLTDVSKSKDTRYRLEGYLYPATYNYYKDQSLEDIVEPMIKKENSIMADKYEDIKAKGLNVHKVLTLASLVEKEGVSMQDRKNIAGVFFNRLDADMPLQSDISVLYALDEQKVHLSNEDTKVDSPYNLYKNKGYGPGPFNNPSEAAIDAVVYPTKNDYYYFLADIKDHKIYFAKTYEEHLEQKEKYIEAKK